MAKKPGKTTETPAKTRAKPRPKKKNKPSVVPCLIAHNNQLLYLQSPELIQFKFEQLINILLATKTFFHKELLREAQTGTARPLEGTNITVLEGLHNAINQIILANPKMQEIVEGIEATYRISIAKA